MAFLGSKSAHEECGVRIMEYLERAGGADRVLAFDCINLGAPEVARGRWAAMMDATRVLAGCHTNWRGKPCVTYQHFVISPDPRDGVSLDTLREITMEWAHEFFGDEMNPGALGSFEVAVVYHDDNEKRIPHAHVIVNNTNLENARRLHLDKDENQELTGRLQDICKEHGLRYFGEDAAADHLQEEPRYYTKQERKLIRQGKFSWKQDIANHVVVARRVSTDEQQFLDTCAMYGVKVEMKDGDYLFRHYHNEDRWKVSGHRLGRNYERAVILSKLEANSKLHGEGIDVIRKNISAKLVLDLFEHMETAAVVKRGSDVADVAMTLHVNARYQIAGLADYDKRIEYYRSMLRSAQTEERRGVCKHCIDELRKARECASSTGLFAGAQPAQPPSRAFSAKLANVPRGGRDDESSASGGRRRAADRQAQRNPQRGQSRAAKRDKRI